MIKHSQKTEILDKTIIGSTSQNQNEGGNTPLKAAGQAIST
jgi:hypothetical protein